MTFTYSSSVFFGGSFQLFISRVFNKLKKKNTVTKDIIYTFNDETISHTSMYFQSTRTILCKINIYSL